MEKRNLKLRLLSQVIIVVLVVVGLAIYFSFPKSEAIQSTLSALSGQKTATNTAVDNTNGQAVTENDTTNASAGKTKTTTDSVKTNQTQEDSGNKENTGSQNPTGTLTPETFGQLEPGLSYEQVTAIIGAPVQLVSEYGTRGTPERTATYLYRGKDNQKMEAILVYQASKLSEMMQIALGESAK